PTLPPLFPYTTLFRSIDVRVPGMLFASIVRPPVVGGKIKHFEASKAKAVPGVRRVVEISTGVAVVADDTWAALKGRSQLDVSFRSEEHTSELQSRGHL